METDTQTFDKATGLMQETFKTTADLYTKTSLSMLNAYNRQLGIGYELCNNFIENTLKSKSDESYQFSFDWLKKNADTFQKTLTETINLSKEVTEKIFTTFSKQNSFSPISKEVTDSVMNIFRKQTEVISNGTEQFLSFVNKKYDFKNYSAQWEDLIQRASRSSEQTIKNLIDTYNTEAEFSKQATNQLFDNISKQFDLLTKTNQEFFNNLFKAIQDKTKTTNGKTNNANPNSEKVRK